MGVDLQRDTFYGGAKMPLELGYLCKVLKLELNFLEGKM